MKMGGGILILISLIVVQFAAARFAVATPRHCPEIPITDQWPEKISGTGIYSNTGKATFAPEFFDYNVNIPLWSSGAGKRKAVCIAGDQPLAIPAEGWIDLPDGSIAVKEFSFDLNGGKKRLETRIILRRNGKWVLKTYRWSEDQRDAVRVDQPETVTLSAPGSPRWEFMPTYRCQYCHYSEGRDHALGFTAAQLNNGSQIEAWIKSGFVAPGTKVSSLPRYPELTDATLTPYRKMRLYLQINCAHCHRPGGMNSLMDLRYGTPLADMRIVNQSALIWGFNIPDAKRVKPFSKEQSVLWLRMQIDGSNSNHMPPLGTFVPDREAVDFVGRWIDSGAVEDGAGDEKKLEICNGGAK